MYAAEVALALEHVHSYEVLFRDLKPENVMIGVDGESRCRAGEVRTMGLTYTSVPRP